MWKNKAIQEYSRINLPSNFCSTVLCFLCHLLTLVNHTSTVISRCMSDIFFPEQIAVCIYKAPVSALLHIRKHCYNLRSEKDWRLVCDLNLWAQSDFNLWKVKEAFMIYLVFGRNLTESLFSQSLISEWFQPCVTLHKTHLYGWSSTGLILEGHCPGFEPDFRQNQLG